MCYNHNTVTHCCLSGLRMVYIQHSMAATPLGPPSPHRLQQQTAQWIAARQHPTSETPTQRSQRAYREAIKAEREQEMLARQHDALARAQNAALLSQEPHIGVRFWIYPFGRLLSPYRSCDSDLKAQYDSAWKTASRRAYCRRTSQYGRCELATCPCGLSAISLQDGLVASNPYLSATSFRPQGFYCDIVVGVVRLQGNLVHDADRSMRASDMEIFNLVYLPLRRYEFTRTKRRRYRKFTKLAARFGVPIYDDLPTALAQHGGR
jgi:hypothetical protein